MEPRFQWTRFLPTKTVLSFATLGPIAYWTKAPGTMGSVAGIFWYTTIFHFLEPVAYFLIVALSIVFAAHICGEAEARLMKRDPGEVILDEFVVIPICFYQLQATGAFHMLGKWSWVLLLSGFLLFRFFDILKPLGIAKLQDLPGGWGVVADDVAAAAATCICLHLGMTYLAPHLLR